MYKYQRPKGDKYTISMGKWNKTFAKRGRPFINKVEVYMTEDGATCQYVMSTFGKLVFILLTPLFYILGTILVGFKEAHGDIKSGLFQKSKGAFSSDFIFPSNREDWRKLQYLIWEKYKSTRNPPAYFDRPPPPPAPPPAPCNCKCGGCR